MEYPSRRNYISFHLQQAYMDATADEKWQVVERIFKMDESQNSLR